MRRILLRTRIIVIGAILAVLVVCWFIFGSAAPHDYQVTDLSAGTWELPSLGDTLHGSSGRWDLRFPFDQHELISVRFGKVHQIGEYMADICHAPRGTAAHWRWVAHSNHTKAHIIFGSCGIDLQRINGSHR